MNLLLKTTLRLKDSVETRALIDLLKLEFPSGRYEVYEGRGIRILHLDLDITVTPRQKKLFLDILQMIESFMLDTIYITGRVGGEALAGYLGPERFQKEKSRARLMEIKSQIDSLLPEHRFALLAFLNPA